MRPTEKVNFWAIKELGPNKVGKKPARPYGVRWVTAGQEHSEWYATKALAKKRLSKLSAAANNGESFDIDTGLPESMYREKNSRTLLQIAQRYIEIEWPDSSANTRSRHVNTLAVAVGAFVRQSRYQVPDAKVLRLALTTHLLPVNTRDAETSADVSAAADWIVKHSRPVNELADPEIAGELLRCLGWNLNGTAAKTWTTRTRRGVLHHALSYAVRVGELSTNPVSEVKTGKGRGNVEVDPRVVVNPSQGRQLLAAVTYAGSGGHYEYLYAFFATMYYAALRPCEVNRLRETDCKLPETGWGELILEQSASRAAARYTDTGVMWENRPLKRRADGAVRVVPIPAQLVAILRNHLGKFGTTSDGRLFRGTLSDGPVNATVYTDAWKRARIVGLTPAQAKSSLARRPYDLRHAAVSTWLAAGVPIAEVAQRAGHTVDVLLKVYARCLDDQTDSSNQRIDGLLDD